MTVFDLLKVEQMSDDTNRQVLNISNPTKYDVSIVIVVEDSKRAIHSNFVQNDSNMRKIFVKAGESVAETM